MSHHNKSAAARKRRQKAIMRRRIVSGILTVGLCVGTAAALNNFYSSRINILNQEIAELSTDVSRLANENQTLSAALQKSNEQLSLYVDTTQVLGAAAPIYNIPLSEELQQYTYDMCTYYMIPEHYELVLAMMWQESNYTPDTVSSTNDYGIMQINQCNHAWLKEQLGITDFLDAKQSIESGTYIISKLLHKYGDEHKALMAYNMGEGGASNVWSAGNYSSEYSRGVIAKRDAIVANNYSAS